VGRVCNNSIVVGRPILAAATFQAAEYYFITNL